MNCKSGIKRRGLLCLPAALWYAVIFFFSAQPGEESAQLSDSLALELLDLGLFTGDGATPMTVLTFFLRKGAHMGVYFVLTALLLLALRGLFSPLRRGALAVGLCAVLAGLDELHQYFVPGRSCQLRDVILDTLGGVCFALAWTAVLLVKKRRRAKAAAGAVS